MTSHMESLQIQLNLKESGQANVRIVIQAMAFCDRHNANLRMATDTYVVLADFQRSVKRIVLSLIFSPSVSSVFDRYQIWASLFPNYS